MLQNGLIKVNIKALQPVMGVIGSVKPQDHTTEYLAVLGFNMAKHGVNMTLELLDQIINRF